MEFSLLYFSCFLFILLSTADQTELNPASCPTSRRLLFFNGFSFSLGEKKPEPISSSSKSSPSKYARPDNAHGLTVYIRPQTSNELGRKVRSYSHLLKSKLFTKEERAKLKALKSEKKKSSIENAIKKKNTTQQATKTRDLVAVNDQERDRCRALLQIDHQNSLIPTKEIKKTKSNKQQPGKNSLSSKVKNITSQAKKKLATKVKSSPVDDKKKSKKVNAPKKDKKTAPKEKKKKQPADKSSESPPLTSSHVNEVPVKRQAPPPPPPPPSSSPPPTQSSANSKSKREKPPPVTEAPSTSLDADELIDLDQDEKNNSVVGRAYHFVKNMFQLSDDILENNHTHEEDQILSSTNEQQQQQHRHSRKLLSIDDDSNNCPLSLDFDELAHQESLLLPSNDLSSSVTHISKRQLLSVKTSKRSTSAKDKKTNSDANKPKVGWRYRYRISRFFADQKTKRSGHMNRLLGAGKAKQQPNSKPSNKKTSASSDATVSKRKLLELDSDEESSADDDDRSNDDIVDSVLLTQEFVPKRQLFSSSSSKKVNKVKEVTDDDENDAEKTNERRRMKSFEELTDPVEIVRSYDRGLFKPRVGWQFRYRVSRYIDSLRENIREDQQRLKLGLQAIKRKTPQELSGRRKRVLDKPFASEVEETPAMIDESKPNVGWRYRYRVSKMLEAKKRGEYVDDEEEKRKARLGQKHKAPGRPHADDDDCLEWEFDMDPELRKISEEGRRVGWEYRYRVRRKLDELKQKQAETGVPFNLETLGGKREKKVITTTPSPTTASEGKSAEADKKAVGWKYRYRVSKMREAQKHDEAVAATKSTSKKHENIPVHERLDPALVRLTPEERAVGWQYRYRIRRKLDTLNDAARDTEGGKRSRQQLSASKRKEKEKIIKQVEESIEKILNIDDIDETPFMEYFRRSSIYIFSGLIPTGRKSICLLPLPVVLSFCKDNNNEVSKTTVTTTESPKHIPVKKLRTKKEKRAKQFIHSRSTKLDTMDEKIDDPIKPLSKTPTTVIEKPQKKPARPRSRPSTRRNTDEQIKHFDEEEQPVKKLIGVETKKQKNKKRFQIIGQEVKIKHKHSATPSTTNPPPVVQTTPSTPLTTTSHPPTVRTTPATTTRPPPVVTTPPPTIVVPKPTRPPPSEPQIISTTTSAPLRSIPELIEEEEAATLLSTKSTHLAEINEKLDEANEDVKATTTTTTTSLPPVNDSPSSSDDDTGSTSDDSESDGSDSESSSTDSDSNSSNDDYDPAPIQKLKQFYENAKESVFDSKDDQDSS